MGGALALRGLKKAQSNFDYLTPMINAYMNNSTADREAIMNAARRANSYQDFIKMSGLQDRANAYNAAAEKAPTIAYLKSTGRVITDPNSSHHEYDHGWDGEVPDYDPEDIGYRKDMSGYADADMGARANSLLTQGGLENWFKNAGNVYGKETVNADAGAIYTGNAPSSGDGGSSASGGIHRQGGDQVTTDAMRTDHRGDDTLLGGKGGGRLKEKETLF